MICSGTALSTQRLSIRSEPEQSVYSEDPKPPPYDDQSARSLLRKTSDATTNDYESTISPAGDGLPAARHRNGVGSNVRRLFHKPSLLSSRTQSTFDGTFAHGRPGWWHKQMLVDRSLRSMAAFTAVCGLVMWIIIFSYLPAFANRLNLHSTSVGQRDGTSCGTAESRNVVCIITGLP